MIGKRFFMAGIVAGAFSFAAVAAVLASPAAGDAEAANREVIEQAFDKWASGGTTFFQDVLHDDVVWTIEGSSSSAGEFRGLQTFIEKAVRPFVSRLRSPVRPTAVQVLADGDHVVAFWQGEAVARDGQPYSNSYAWILRMRDGKAEAVNAFLDLAPYDDVLRRVQAQP